MPKPQKQPQSHPGPRRPAPPPHTNMAPACVLLAALVAGAGATAATAGANAGDVDPRGIDAGPEPAPAPHTIAPSAAATAPVADTRASGPWAADAPPGAEDPTPPTTDERTRHATPDRRDPVANPTVPVPDARDPRQDPDALPVEATVDAATPPEAARTGFGFGGVPALNYDADNGFGFGVVGTLYWYDGATDPYRLAITLQIFMTSRLVQDHNLQVDWLRAFGLPLRVFSRVGYLQSLTQNFCGFGGDVTCDPSVARAEGRELGLAGDKLDEFERRYYLRRFMSPYGLVNLRWTLDEAPKPRHFKVDFLAGYRRLFFAPGNWFSDEDGDRSPDFYPYPDSLYAREFPDGEPGYLSTLLGGFILDTRDNEPAPTEGVFLETTLRGASRLWGSAWTYAGLNVSLRTFVPLNASRSIVFAARTVGDAVLGDPPVQELARIGGTLDNYAFGGADLGRGIRAQRYLGKLRFMNQSELRWRFWDFEVLEQRFALVAAGLVDTGVTGASLDEPGLMPLQVGFGGGLRIGWNENFWIRFDLAVSPVEGYTRNLYVVVNNPF